MDTKSTCTGCKKFMLHLRTSDIKCQTCKTHLFKDDETVEQVAEIVHSSVCVGRGSAPHVTAIVTGASGDAKVTTAITAGQIVNNYTQKEEKGKDVLEERIKSFKDLIKNHKPYFDFQTTKSLDQVKKSLINNQWVIITGFPKEGKTTLAANAADWFVRRKLYDGVFYQDPQSVSLPKTQEKNPTKSITIIDNMLEENDESWDTLDFIQNDLSSENTSNIYVIVCQLYNLKRARWQMETDLLDDRHVVNVSVVNSQCTGSELEPVLRSISDLSLQTKKEITTAEYLLGLPGICFHYNKKKHFPKDKFFVYPHSFYKDLLTLVCNSDRKKRATFIMLLVCGGEIDLRNIKDGKYKNMMQLICKYFVDASLSWDDIEREIDHLTGSFFKKSEPHIIGFRYQVMYDACVVAVDRLYPGDLWKECRLWCINTDTMNISSNGSIVLTKSNSTVIVEDFMQSLLHKHFMEVLTNDMLRDKEIMDQLHEKMKLHFQSLLQSSDSEHGGNFLYWCLKSKNDLLLGSVKPQIDPKDKLIITSAIRSCIETRSDDLLRLLLTRVIPAYSHDEYVNFRDCNGNTPLMNASEDGSVCIAKVLLEFGADPCAVDNNEQSCVHVVAIYDHLELYTFFEDTIPITQFNQVDIDGCSPTHLVDKKKGKILTYLRNKPCKNTSLADGFDCNGSQREHFDGLKDISVHDADKLKRKLPLSPSQLIYSRYFDINRGKGADFTGIDHQNQNDFSQACFEDNAELVNYLLHDRRFDIHTRDKLGRTPLMYAAQFGCRNVFDLLLGQGADISVLDHDNKNVLHRACYKDNAEFVQYLVCEKRSDVHTRDKLGRTPLMYAALFGCRNVFDLLLVQGADISVLDHDNSNVLHQACSYDNAEFVKYLVCEKRSDVHTRDKFGRTPLMYAAQYGCRNDFDLLLVQGADISVLNQDNGNVLHHACTNDNAEFVQYLVCEKKVDVHTSDKLGRTPLMFAAHFGCRNVFDLLLGQGADISVLDHDNNNVLHRACYKDNGEFVQYLVCEKRSDVHTRDKLGRTPLMYAAHFGCRNVFDLLLGQGADISVLDHDNNNVLHRACYNDNAEFVQYLVCEKRFDVHTRDKYGRTPLMYAAEFGCINVFDLLLGQGADISVLDHDNNNVLHRACYKDNAEFVKYLVCEKRSDVHTRDKYGRTPLMYAAQFGCRNVFDLLLVQGADISVLDHDNSNVLHRACSYDNAEFVKYLVCEKRSDVHTRDKFGRTPLMYAAQYGCRNDFDLLLVQGADISVLNQDNGNVLHHACTNDNAEFVQYLVYEKKVDVHTSDKLGRTPLMYAANFGCRNVFDLLLGQGADISVLDHDNNNVLHRACYKDNAEFVQYLVCEKRFDVHTRGKYGRTPLMYAAEFGCRNVFDLLLGQGADISVLERQQKCFTSSLY